MTAAGSVMPSLTVVIPTHEGERWLAETLGSLVAQTDPGLACILIDSSPTPATIAIAEAFRDRLNLRIEHRPDIKEWTQKTNLGAELATTRYFCMLHQDDLWAPDRAAAIRRWLEAAPDVVMHLHPSWIIDGQSRRLGLWRCPFPALPNIPADVVRDRLIVQNFVAICAPVMRRDAFLAVGGLDRGLWYTADWDLYLKLSRLGPLAYHVRPLASFRVHATSQTIVGSRKPEDFEAQMTAVLHRHEDGIGASVRHRARVAIVVNTALAAAFHGQRKRLFGASCAIMGLGPRGAFAFLRDTRLLERLLPRLRARVRGRFAL